VLPQIAARTGADLVKPFETVFGRLAPDPKLAEATLRRIVRRVQRMADQGAPPSGLYADVAALRERAAEEARYDREAMAERYPATEMARGIVERQRRNLAQFRDVRELVRGWRTGNIAWDADRWGPDPDDPDCLVPWDVVKEAR
jgi:hypothetical protein